MKVLVISEGKHELTGALETIVRRLTGIDGAFDLLKVSDPAVRVHHAKGPGYFKKAVRCLRYAAEHGYDAVGPSRPERLGRQCVGSAGTPADRLVSDGSRDGPQAYLRTLHDRNH